MKEIVRQRLFTRFPELALKLIIVDRRGVSIKEGSLEVDGIVLDDDSIDADRWFQSLDLHNIDILYVYGVGLGRYYQAASQWLRGDEKRRLVFLEDDIRVIDCLMVSPLGEEMLCDHQVSLYLLEDLNQRRKLIEWLASISVNVSFEVSVLECYSKHRQNNYVEIRECIFAESAAQQAINNEFVRTAGRTFLKNFCANAYSLKKASFGNDLFGKFTGVPAIICGSGPSLTNALPVLQQLSNNALIMVGGSSLVTLSKNNIVPHLVFGVDPLIEEYRRQYYNAFFETPFCYNTRINHNALPMIHSKMLYFSSNVGYSIVPWLENKLGLRVSNTCGGIFTSTYCIDLAYCLGCNPIVFLGMDLSAQGVPSDDNNPWHNAPLPNLLKAHCAQENYRGDAVTSCWEWIFGMQWLVKYIKDRSHKTFVNIVDEGIAIDGAVNMTLDEATTKYLSRQYDLNNYAYDMVGALSSMGIEQQQLDDSFEEMLQSMQQCQEYCRQLIKLLSQNDSRAADVMRQQLKDEVAYTILLGTIEQLYDQEHYLDYAAISRDPNSSYEQRKIKNKALWQEKYHFLDTVLTTHLNIIDTRGR